MVDISEHKVWSCASRGRSNGDWHSSEHQQKLEIGSGDFSNCISSVTKDFLLIQKTNETMEKEKDYQLTLPEELKGKKFRIRKLTPRECFRLMDVDDADIDKIQATGISNSSQYKLAGNSIVVSCLYHLLRKLLIEKGPEPTDEPRQQMLF